MKPSPSKVYDALSARTRIGNNTPASGPSQEQSLAAKVMHDLFRKVDRQLVSHGLHAEDRDLSLLVTRDLGLGAMKGWRPGWWERETASHQQFTVNTLGFDDSVLTVSLDVSGDLVPHDFELASCESFWKEVLQTVLDSCPGSVRSRRCYSELDDDLYTDLPKRLDQKATEDLATKTSEALETKAKTRWLRPGVPALSVLVRKHLLDRKAVLEGVVEFQHKYGYKETKQLLEQYSNTLLCSDLGSFLHSLHQPVQIR